MVITALSRLSARMPSQAILFHNRRESAVWGGHAGVSQPARAACDWLWGGVKRVLGLIPPVRMPVPEWFDGRR